MATGAIQVYGVSRIFSKCPIFGVSKMASAGPNHLTAEDVFKIFANQAVSRIEYVTLVDVSFRRSQLLSGKFVGQAHFVNTLRP